MIEKMNYEAPAAQVVVFPMQDVVTTSSREWIELPDEEFD